MAAHCGLLHLQDDANHVLKDARFAAIDGLVEEPLGAVLEPVVAEGEGVAGADDGVELPLALRDI